MFTQNDMMCLLPRSYCDDQFGFLKIHREFKKQLRNLREMGLKQWSHLISPTSTLSWFNVRTSGGQKKKALCDMWRL